jgi:hypothetical protein
LILHIENRGRRRMSVSLTTGFGFEGIFQEAVILSRRTLLPRAAPPMGCIRSLFRSDFRCPCRSPFRKILRVSSPYPELCSRCSPRPQAHAALAFNRETKNPFTGSRGRSVENWKLERSAAASNCNECLRNFNGDTYQDARSAAPEALGDAEA